MLKSRPPELTQAIRLIKKNYNDKLELDELAEIVSVNKYNLIRMFKKYMNHTPYEYLMYYRVQKAKSMLAETLLSVNEISRAVGIGNVSYFIKVFKNYENVTPAQYQRNIKEKG